MSAVSVTTGPVQHGLAHRASPGERSSGDAALVVATACGALIAVVDGLGHGPDAAVAADAATGVLSTFAEEPPPQVLRRCHSAMHHTRGAAVSIAVVDQVSGTLEWVAVGNVQGLVVDRQAGTRTRLVTRGGVVGMRLPLLRSTTVPLTVGDVLVMFSDGVADAAAREPLLVGDPQAVADQLLERHATGVDDALVLVARYRGGAP